MRRPKSPPVQQIEILVGDEADTTVRRPLAEPFRPMDQRQISDSRRPASRSVGPTPAGLTQLPLSTVAAHVAEHVSAGTRALAEQASNLGQRIVAEDEQFDVQLKAKFDHAVGTLASSTPASIPPPVGATPASQIAAMLASPEGIRQAVVLNEILRRPADRW